MITDRYLAACVHAPWSDIQAHRRAWQSTFLLCTSILAFIGSPVLIFIGMGQVHPMPWLVALGMVSTVGSLPIGAWAGIAIQATQPIDDTAMRELLDTPLAGACLTTAVNSWRQEGFRMRFRDYWAVRDAIEYRKNSTGRVRAAPPSNITVAQGAS